MLFFSAMKDVEILDALQGSGDVVRSLRFHCLRRNGHLLLALPKDKELSLLTLSLYQPQTSKAKLLAKGLSAMIKLGLHRLLPRLDMQIRSDSALADFVLGRQRFGFLLGNPEAEARRAIVLYRDGNALAVAKVGVGEVATMSVEAEATMIRSLPKNHVGIPCIRKYSGRDEWYYYSTSLSKGAGPKWGKDGQSLAVLAQWMKHFEVQKLRETSVWNLLRSHDRVTESDSYVDFIEGLGGLEIKVGLYHGDFAPWNIKISDDGEVCVLDWEHARLDGLGGWDWLHYMTQHGTLVSNHSAIEVLTECRLWASTSEGRSFLSAAGWGRYTEEWLGSYLMYSAWIAGFERDELLQAWSDGV